MHDKHPELWHYTTEAGLEGILTSKQLWATNFRCLNDTLEMRHLRSFLESYLLHDMKGARQILDILYESFPQNHSGGPFITSFCSHARSDEWTTQHGLLSQWRAYADGGYAIVFDTKELRELLLTQEHAAYHYWYMGLNDVIYGNEKHKCEEECSELLAIIPDAVNDIVCARLANSPNVDRLFQAFVGATSRLKHRAFREESEVRIVAYPSREDKAPEQVRTPTRFFKRTYIRCGNISYIKLFDANRNLPLPIKRIVVGPCSRQVDLRAKALRLVADQDFPVECSYTPYIERQPAKPQ